jgi:iron complex outermembrane receptor protein
MMKTIGFFTGLLLINPFTIAFAQDSTASNRDTIFYLSPVIVNPMEARERETPATFSTLNQKTIGEQYSVQDIPVLLSELPSTTFSSDNGNGIGYNYINIRGFDQRRLSIMINGVPQNDPEDHNVYWIDFPDLLASAGNIQVQRGAGSSFYGPPAIGGSVNITTNPFADKPGITLESDMGFQQFADSSSSLALTTRKYSATIQSGLVNRQYMFYGRLADITSGGYRKDSWVDLTSYFLGAVRFDKNMVTRFHFFGGPLTDGLAYSGIPKFTGQDNILRRSNWGTWSQDSNDVNYSSSMRRVVSGNGLDTVYVIPRRSQESEGFSQPHVELLNEWKPTSSLTLSNVVFYYTGDGYYDYDASWADTSMLRIGYRYGYPTTQNPSNALVRAFVGNKQWGWLPHIEIEQGTGSLTLGGEVRIHRSTHWGKIEYADNLPVGFNPDYHFYEYNGEKDIFSFYVHELYRPDEATNILADIQFIHNRYGIENEKYLGYNFSIPYFFVNPRLGVNYNMNDSWNGYCSIGYTSREPVLRNLYAAEDSYFGETPQFRAIDTVNGVVHYDFSDPIKKAEHLMDLEFGAGYHTPDAHLTANVYWMEFTDELVETGQLDIFGDPITVNADRTRHIGIECEGAITFQNSLTLSGNVSFSSNKFVHFHYPADSDTGLITLDKNTIAGFPDALGNIRFTYRTGGFIPSLLVKYVGDFYTDNFENANNKNDAYTVVDLDLLYQKIRVGDIECTLRAEVHNLFNRLYFLSGDGDSFFPAAERNFITGISVHL